MMDCVFCKIITGEISSTKVFEDERCLAFLDIYPQAKEHVLVIPKQHIASLAKTHEGDADLLAHLLLICTRVARERDIDVDGYRVAINTGEQACQSVPHLHFHVLGGEKLSPSMG